MLNTIPKIGEKLTPEQIKFLEVFAKSCRASIIGMLKNSQSGHPGGSLSCIDYLTLIYSFIISQTGNPVVVSNGHISPAVYSILAELKWVSKEDLIKGFRQLNSIFEGHVARHVPGVWYGTGPLGIGTSVSSAFAFAEKAKGANEKVFCLMGDGEAQEGQVYEMMHFAKKYKLDNLIFFMDFNEVQLTDSLKEIMPVDLKATFLSGGWEVIEVDGHNFEDMWNALAKAYEVKGSPVMIIGHTIMGKGIELMEKEGEDHKSVWHGVAPKPADADLILEALKLSDEEVAIRDEIMNFIRWNPAKPEFKESLSEVKIDGGDPILYEAGTVMDLRSAYGKALLDLAKRNKNVYAITADLMGSVQTKGVHDEVPNQHIEVGIAEQHVVSLGGGLSLAGIIPFTSTFGAFLSSRAKDQARVNDINKCNVKMVATHCGLSVGEDGPTHQAIDDMSSFLGMFNTMVIEPADANHCDRIIRYIATHYGNFYVRMGRHKFEVILNEKGEPFYGKDYVYEYGKADVIRGGADITVVASGCMVGHALNAIKEAKKSVELIAASSIKKFDEIIFESIKKTGNLITIEDHNVVSGLGSQLSKELLLKGITPKKIEILGIKNYQRSGKSDDLYEDEGLSASKILEVINKF